MSGPWVPQWGPLNPKLCVFLLELKSISVLAVKMEFHLGEAEKYEARGFLSLD